MLFQKYKTVTQKPDGRIFAIGDVHGCLDELNALLKLIAFDENRDQVVFVGDLADRGPKNIETIQFVLSNPCFHLVAGNHEDLLVEHITQGQIIPDDMMEYWLGEDGVWTKDIDESVLLETVQNLSLNSYYIIEVVTNNGTRFGVTHAGYFDCEWFNPEKQYEDLYFRRLMWVRESAESLPGNLNPTSGIDFTIHGHTIFKQPRINGNAVFIDTGCCIGGKLTALNLGEFAHLKEINRQTVCSI